MLIESLPKIRGQYRQNAALKNWFDVGGPSEILLRPADFQDLQFFLKNAPKDLPITTLGAASNVIIDDVGIAGVVIKMGAEFAKISHQAKAGGAIEVLAGAATPCANLAAYCQVNGIGGLEFFATIPGSVGGAVAMNAGCYGSETADILREVVAVDFAGNLAVLSALDCEFSYRNNQRAGDFIFTSALFVGFASKPELIAAKIEQFKKNRELSQPIRVKTGGSTFKNPTEAEIADFKKNHPEKKWSKSWEFIDAIGFRGKNFGDAKFSEKHCNFLINTGKAKADDLLSLARAAQEEVFKRFGVSLHLEIKHLK